MEPPIRRRDRAVEDEAWIEDFLARAAAGTLVIHAADRPQVNANIFVYEKATRSLFAHTARHGATRAALGAAGEATFIAFEMGRVLPARRAIGFSVEYASVVARGALTVVERDEAKRALHLLMDKYAPHMAYGLDYDGVSEGDLAQTSVYRLAIASWSAKRNAKPPDFPGAYPYGGPYPVPGPAADTETP